MKFRTRTKEGEEAFFSLIITRQERKKADILEEKLPWVAMAL